MSSSRPPGSKTIAKQASAVATTSTPRPAAKAASSKPGPAAPGSPNTSVPAGKGSQKGSPAANPLNGPPRLGSDLKGKKGAPIPRSPQTANASAGLTGSPRPPGPVVPGGAPSSSSSSRPKSRDATSRDQPPGGGICGFDALGGVARASAAATAAAQAAASSAGGGSQGVRPASRDASRHAAQNGVSGSPRREVPSGNPNGSPRREMPPPNVLMPPGALDGGAVHPALQHPDSQGAESPRAGELDEQGGRKRPSLAKGGKKKKKKKISSAAPTRPDAFVLNTDARGERRRREEARKPPLDNSGLRTGSQGRARGRASALVRQSTEMAQSNTHVGEDDGLGRSQAQPSGAQKKPVSAPSGQGESVQVMNWEPFSAGAAQRQPQRETISLTSREYVASPIPEPGDDDDDEDDDEDEEDEDEVTPALPSCLRQLQAVSTVPVHNPIEDLQQREFRSSPIASPHASPSSHAPTNAIKTALGATALSNNERLTSLTSSPLTCKPAAIPPKTPLTGQLTGRGSPLGDPLGEKTSPVRTNPSAGGVAAASQSLSASGSGPRIGIDPPKDWVKEANSNLRPPLPSLPLGRSATGSPAGLSNEAESDGEASEEEQAAPVCRRSKMLNCDKMIVNAEKPRIASPQGSGPEKLPRAAHPAGPPAAPPAGPARPRGISILSERRASNGGGGGSERGDEKKTVRFSMESNVEVLALEEVDWLPQTSRGPRRTFGGELQQHGGPPGANPPYGGPPGANPRAQTAGNIGRAAAGRLPAVYTSIAPRAGPSNAMERLGVRDLGALSPENQVAAA